MQRAVVGPRHLDDATAERTQPVDELFDLTVSFTRFMIWLVGAHFEGDETTTNAESAIDGGKVSLGVIASVSVIEEHGKGSMGRNLATSLLQSESVMGIPDILVKMLKDIRDSS